MCFPKTWSGEVSPLNLKLLRDLRASRWQYAAVGSMVAIGVAVFGASYMSYRNLDASYSHSYARQHFEDFGIEVRAAPERVVDRIRQIPGVRAAEGRLLEDVQIELPGPHAKKLIGRLITIPPGRRPTVNDLRVVEGRYLPANPSNEVLLESSFAKYHGLHPGDAILASRGGSRVRFKVQGIVRSSEYVFVVRSKQDLMPFPDTFGVMFVAPQTLGPIVGKSGLISEVKVITFRPEAAEGTAHAARRLLMPYGAKQAVLREDQPSHQLLQQDVEGFRMYSVLFPALFFSVAALAIYSLLLRLVHQQRTIIGLLRSLGMSRATVVGHYVAAGLVVGAVSSSLGSAVALWLSGLASRSYLAQITVPYERIEFEWPPIAIGWLSGILVCIAACLSPALAASRVRPAEMLRPEVPPAGRTVRIDAWFPNLSLIARIPIRNVVRQPRRTLSSLFGIAAGLAMILLSRGLLDSVDIAMESIVSGAFRSDLRLDFVGYRDAAIVQRVRSWKGVVWAEGSLEVPVEIGKNGNWYSVLLIGTQDPSLLHVPRDETGREVPLAGGGIVLGQSVKTRLGLHRGEIVLIRLPETMTEQEPKEHVVRVSDFVWEEIGTVAYAPRGQVRTLFHKDLGLPLDAVSTIRVENMPGHEATVRRRLLDLPSSGSVTAASDLKQTIEGMMGFFRSFVLIMELFGAGLAFAMVYNISTVGVLERGTEVATMRMLGIGRTAVAAMVAAENLLVTVLGIIIGLPLGRAFVQWFWVTAQTEEQMELMSFNVQIHSSTYAIGACLVFFVSALSLWPGLVHVDRIDIAKATKERAN